MTDDTFDPAKVDLDRLLDHLFSRENGDQQSIVADGDLLSQLDKALTGLEATLSQSSTPSQSSTFDERPDADRLCDKTRIEKFYQRKADLFAKMTQSVDFYDEEAAARSETTTNNGFEVERSGQESVNKLKSMLKELEDCGAEIADLQSKPKRKKTSTFSK